MTAPMMTQPTVFQPPDASVLARVLEEGYGPGAWHGPDLRAALADVGSRAALARPAASRHNIAEIALHHAFYVRSVAGRLTGTEPAPFPLEGEDWFVVDDERRIAWTQIVALLETLQQRLAEIVAGIGAGTIGSPLSPAERFELVLGITCHAVYHAGQVQLVKVLTSAA